MIEIKKVIELFEKALPVYERALKSKKISFSELVDLNIDWGICSFLEMTFKSEIGDSLFNSKGYYQNYLKLYGAFLHIVPSNIRFDDNIVY